MRSFGAAILTLFLAGIAQGQEPGASPLGGDESQPNGATVEIEPNDRISTASPFDPAVELSAELDVRGGDFFRFELHDEGQVRDIVVELETQTLVELCLYEPAGDRIKCTRGSSTRFEALHLEGEYILSVSSPRVLDESIPYRLKTSPPRTPDAGYEIEPNDRKQDVNLLPPATRISGTLLNADTDSFLLRVEGAPQMWRIEARGDVVTWLNLTSGGNIVLQNRTNKMDNLLLRAGDYIVQLRGGKADDRAYTLTATPMGPPDKLDLSEFSTDPDAALPGGRIEEEPNDLPGQAQRLRFDEPWVGTLERGDVDAYRFYLQGQGRVRITVVPPADGSARLIFDSGTRMDSAAAGQSVVFEDDILAGDHYLTLRALTPANGLYRLIMTQLNPLTVDPGLSDVVLTLTGGADSLAAYSAAGQRIKLGLRVTNNSKSTKNLDVVTSSSAHAWNPYPDQTTLSLAPGQSKRVAVNVDVLPDARADHPVLVSVGVRDGSGNIASRSISMTAACDAPAVSPRQIWPLPDELLGRLNVASPSLGAELLSTGRYLEQGFDGTVSRNTGLYAKPGDPIRIDLAGDAPVTLLGTLIHPAGRTSIGRDAQLKEFEILTSLDGTTFTSVFEGSLKSATEEQYFVFDRPVRARFAELRPKSNYGEPNYVALGEWKVLAEESAASVTGGALNIADVKIGGYDVYSDPFVGAACCRDSFSTAGPDGQYSQRNQASEWVLGFRDNRAAQITGFGWVDRAGRRVAQDMPTVRVAVSLVGPLGPWQTLGDWTLTRGESGVPRWPLAEPVWARFVKFSTPPLENAIANTPQQIQVFEQEADGRYRSVIGEWGFAKRAAVYEYLNPPVFANTATAIDGENDDRSHALTLSPDRAASGDVLVGEDVDWYAIDVPVDVNQLRFDLRGDPGVDYAFEVQDASGNTLEFDQKATDNEVAITVAVGPGRYYLKLYEPPRSIIFVWDTSGSVGVYYDVIDQTMKAFADGVRRGREEIQLLPFSDGPLEFLLEDWSGAAGDVTAAIVNSERKLNSSNVEKALAYAAAELEEREGTRAVMLITDAESDGYVLTKTLWNALNRARPRIFSLEISSKGTQVGQHMMQSYADVNNGFYDPAFTAGDLEVGLDRATCILRRPKTYYVVAHLDAVEPKLPGWLKVTIDDDANVGARSARTGDAVEVIFDASGSMFQKLDGRFRYEIAKDVLDDLLATTMPENIGFALRVFGNHDASSCRSDLELPLAPLDRAAARAAVAGIEPQPFAYTPIADSLAKVAQDLRGADGRRTVVLVTDGEESCDGDVEAAIAGLKAGGVDMQLNVIGFDFDADDKEAVRGQFRRWASLGDGHYFDARNAEELAQSLIQAVSAPIPYEVLNANGDVVANGIVNGDYVELAPGVYGVQALGSAPQVVDNVVVRSEKRSTVTLEAK